MSFRTDLIDFFQEPIPLWDRHDSKQYTDFQPDDTPLWDRHDSKQYTDFQPDTPFYDRYDTWLTHCRRYRELKKP